MSSTEQSDPLGLITNFLTDLVALLGLNVTAFACIPCPAVVFFEFFMVLLLLIVNKFYGFSSVQLAKTTDRAVKDYHLVSKK